MFKFLDGEVEPDIDSLDEFAGRNLDDDIGACGHDYNGAGSGFDSGNFIIIFFGSIGD